MEKGMEILQHMEKLYAKDYDENYAVNIAKKNPDMVAAWNKAFCEYDLADVLTAIDKYWEFKNSKSRPNVTQITASLNAGKAEKVKSDGPYIAKTDYAAKFMQRDIKLGCCRHLLPVYNQAVRYIAEDLLSREMPVSQWKDLDFAGRVEQAAKKGLFDRLDEVLVMVCRQKYGKDYQFDSKNMLTAAERNNSTVYSTAGAVKGLAAHYSANAGEDFSDTIGF